MKKLLIFTIIICSALLLEARVTGQFGLGLDLNGKQSFSNVALSRDSKVNTGVSLYAEVLSAERVGPGDMLFGLGLEFQVPRELKSKNLDLNTRKFSYLPIYLTGKYVLTPILLSPEVIVQAGYNLPAYSDNYAHSAVNNLKVSGGFYWGMGFGVGFKPIVLQAMYKSSQNTFSWKDIDAQNLETSSTNSQLSLQLGLRF